MKNYLTIDSCSKLIVLILSLIGIGLGLQSRRSLATKRLVLVDGQGRERIAMSMVDDGAQAPVPAIQIYDEDHNARADLSLFQGSTPSLCLRSRDRQHWAWLQLAEEQGPCLSMHGQEDSAISLAVGRAGRTEFEITGANHRCALGLTLLPEEFADLIVTNAGRVRAHLMTSWNGPSELEFFDQGGRSMWRMARADFQEE